MRHSLLYSLALCTLLSGCASGPYIDVSAYTMDARFVRDCVGPNAPYTMRDRECQQKWEPHTQSGQVSKVVKPENMADWQRDIHSRQRCRATGEGCPLGLR